MKPILRARLLISLVWLVGAHAAWAGTSYIVRPVSAFNSPDLELGQGGPPSRLIDNSGLSSELNTGDPIPGTFPTHQLADNSDGDPDNDLDDLEIRWFNSPSTNFPDVLTFDLGGVFVLDSFYLWSYTENFYGLPYNDRGVDAFELTFSLDGNLFGGAQSFRAVATRDFAESAAQTFSLRSVTAAFVKLTITSNHGGNLTGLSEVRFGAAFAPPQPVITGITASSGNVTLTWTSISNEIYRVEYKPMLSATNWTALTPNISATSSTAFFTDNPGSATQRYYRVVLLP